MILALAVVPVALLALGFPVFVVLLAGAATALVFHMNVPLAVLHQAMFGGVESFALLAVPFFIFAGELMAQGSIARRIVDAVIAGTGGMRGSLGVTAVGTATIFGSMSGSSPATVATTGQLLLPSLREHRYGDSFSGGLIASAGSIAIIVPPSIPMILYGAAAEASVPKLYAAGILPGLLIAALLGIYVVAHARSRGIREGARFTGRRALAAVMRSLWALGAPLIILGGIYGGIFSPTEAAGIACVYAALVGGFVYRDLGWRQILDVATSSALLTAQILIIVASAAVFSWLLTVNQVPQALVELIARMDLAQWQTLLAINLLLLLLGCLIDPMSAILVVTPILLPVAVAAGVDPIHFGIIMTVNLAIGMFTPPFGLNIFVAQSVFGLPLAQLYKGLAPFIAIQTAGLLIVTYVPALSLTIPRLIFG